MLNLPSELRDTVELVYALTLNEAVKWPAIDEDQIAVHAKSWQDAAATLNATVDAPTQAPRTLWKPTSNVSPDDKPISAFLEFWHNHPRAHYKRAAEKANTVSLALTQIGTIITSYKNAYIASIQSLYDNLTQDHHALGSSFDLFWFIPLGREAKPSNLWAVTRPQERLKEYSTLKGIAPDEGADEIAFDQNAINMCASWLTTLSNNAQQQMSPHVSDIVDATHALDGIIASATRISRQLPDQTYNNSRSYPNLINPDDVNKPSVQLLDADDY
jgi:hypothetical protein